MTSTSVYFPVPWQLMRKELEYRLQQTKGEIKYATGMTWQLGRVHSSTPVRDNEAEYTAAHLYETTRQSTHSAPVQDEAEYTVTHLYEDGGMWQSVVQCEQNVWRCYYCRVMTPGCHQQPVVRLATTYIVTAQHDCFQSNHVTFYRTMQPFLVSPSVLSVILQWGIVFLKLSFLT